MKKCPLKVCECFTSSQNLFFVNYRRSLEVIFGEILFLKIFVELRV